MKIKLDHSFKKSNSGNLHLYLLAVVIGEKAFGFWILGVWVGFYF